MNYGELKDAIKSYLYDRTDLAGIIPTFIDLAERKMFRVLRVPANEKIATYSEHVDPSILLPTDFLEAKLLVVDGVPVKRISDLQYLKSTAARSASGVPREFARIGAKLHLFPVPGDTSEISLVYWADLSGQLVADTDTHEILRIAPDAYLHGALMEASSYLGQDSRIGTWSALYQSAMSELQSQAQEAEYAGSVLSVSNVYSNDNDVTSYSSY